MLLVTTASSSSYTNTEVDGQNVGRLSEIKLFGRKLLDFLIDIILSRSLFSFTPHQSGFICITVCLYYTSLCVRKGGMDDSQAL